MITKESKSNSLIRKLFVIERPTVAFLSDCPKKIQRSNSPNLFPFPTHKGPLPTWMHSFSLKRKKAQRWKMPNRCYMCKEEEETNVHILVDLAWLISCLWVSTCANANNFYCSYFRNCKSSHLLKPLPKEKGIIGWNFLCLCLQDQKI